MENKILLQLLVFEHATGDLVVQTEVGGVQIKGEPVTMAFIAGTVKHFHRPVYFGMPIREAIDKAVAEQFGQRLEPPLPRIVENEYGGGWFVWNDEPKTDVPLNIGALSALRQVADLPVVYASESQPVSTWVRVFPPEQGDDPDNLAVYFTGWNQARRDMQRETAFTVWRLTVTK